MRKIAIAVAAVAMTLHGDVSPNADYVDGESSQMLITPELQQTAAAMFGTNAVALLHAVALQTAKYDLDMKKVEGRRNWHGRLIREEVSTNGLYKVSVYSNELTGAVWRYREGWKPHRGANASPKGYPSYGTNGVPWRLAAARRRRAAEYGQTNQVDVTVNANGGSAK